MFSLSFQIRNSKPNLLSTINNTNCIFENSNCRLNAVNQTDFRSLRAIVMTFVSIQNVEFERRQTRLVHNITIVASSKQAATAAAEVAMSGDSCLWQEAAAAAMTATAQQ